MSEEKLNDEQIKDVTGGSRQSQSIEIDENYTKTKPEEHNVMLQGPTSAE